MIAYKKRLWLSRESEMMGGWYYLHHTQKGAVKTAESGYSTVKTLAARRAPETEAVLNYKLKPMQYSNIHLIIDEIADGDTTTKNGKWLGRGFGGGYYFCDTEQDVVACLEGLPVSNTYRYWCNYGFNSVFSGYELEPGQYVHMRFVVKDIPWC